MVDAEIIARFADQVRPEARPVADEDAQILGELVARRRQAVEMIGRESDRRRLARSARVVKGTDRILAALRKALAALDREIDDRNKGSPVWREAETPLTSVPGVGPFTARTLVAEPPERGRIHRRRLAALVGASPVNRDSGAMRGRRAIAGGRPWCATSSTWPPSPPPRRNPVIRDRPQRQRAGRPAKTARVAAIRKRLAILDAIVRDGAPWRRA